MTSIVRFDPFSDLRSTMDRLFDEGLSRPWRVLSADQVRAEKAFPVEVSQTEGGLDIKAALPGVKPADVDITVQNDVLTIRAEHKEETEEQKRDFYRREVRYGSFQRSLAVPDSVDADKAEAKFEDGILYLHLPTAETAKPRQIKVHAGANGANGVVASQ